MTHPTPISTEYQRIFDDAWFDEMSRAPEPDQDKILQYVTRITRSTKIHTYFAETNIAAITGDIFRDSILRDFVMCTRDRFLINIAGNEHIGFLDLARIIAGFGIDTKDEFKLVDSIMPRSAAADMSPPGTAVIGILRDNAFLIVPIMLCLNWRTGLEIKSPKQATKPSAKMTSDQA